MDREVNKDPLYTLEWEENPKMFIELDVYKIPMPKMPPKNEIINFDLPPEKQFFKRTVIPDSLLSEKECNEEEELWIKREYHKFDNGIWMYIKGVPLYFPGDYYHFLNYWHVQDGVKPYFYLPQQKLYNLYNFLDRDDDCLGTMLLKARRMRATEITLQRGYFKTFRYRNKNFFLQSKNDTSAEKNYLRVINAHSKMLWFVKPKNRGSTKNSNGLYLEYPSVRITEKKLREIAEAGIEESIYEYPELGGSILYGPSVATHFDGEKAILIGLNEYAKLENMSLIKAVAILRHCVTMNNLKTVIGKLHCESTVEELNDLQFKEVVDFWNASDPAKRNKNNRTTSGLYRIFVSAAETGEPDEYGFVDSKEAERYVRNTIEDLMAQGKIKEAADERRKTPLTIQDALTPSGSDSAFHKERLLETAERLNFPLPGEEPEIIRGNLEWENGLKDTRVIFIPNPEGRWEMSKTSGFQDNFIFDMYGQKWPGNIDKFRSGADPFDHKLTKDQRRSDGASVVFERFDVLKDGDKFVLEGGVRIPKDGGLGFLTNQPISVYCYRHDDPELYYEDMLMQCIFFGTMILVENNKPGMMRYFDTRGYSNLIQNRPVETLTNKNQKPTEGIAATESTISQYFAAIATYVYNYHNAIKFISIINSLISMNRENVTTHDLGVAFGWCLLAVNAEVPNYIDKYIQPEETQEWFQYVEN